MGHRPSQVNRLWVCGKQGGRHHVHPLVGALGREDGGGQKLERVLMIQLTFGTRVLIAQPSMCLGGPSLD